MRKDRQKRFREVLSEWPGDRETARSLAALLDVCADKVFGVLLQNIVDLVEQIVGLVGQLLATLLARGRAGGQVVVIAAATAALGLLLSHRCLLHAHRPWIPRPSFLHPTGRYRRCPVNDPQVVSCSTSSAALSTESSRAPTCALLPRSGSSVGIRTSESPPRSKITESQLAPADSPPNRRRHSPRKYARVSVGGLSTASSTCCSVTNRFIEPRATSRLYRPLSSRTSEYCRSTRCSRGADQLRLSRGRNPSSSRSLAGQSKISAHSIGSRSSRSSTLAHVWTPRAARGSGSRLSTSLATRSR